MKLSKRFSSNYEFCDRRYTVQETWRQLAVPRICERMLGFSVPQNNTVLVVSYEGTHLVRLGQIIIVEEDSENAEYDQNSPGVCRHRGKTWDMLGLYSGRPIHNGLDGEQLVVDATLETITIVKGEEEVWSSVFENFSGDWVAATFSPDGRFIVLGWPYDIDFRVWEKIA